MRARAATTLISMGFTSLLPPPMTSWKVISCPINPAVAEVRALSSDEFTTSETGDSGASLRYGIPMISSWWYDAEDQGEILQAPFLYPGADGTYIDVPEITPPARVGWFFSRLLVSAESTWISTWIATKFAYLSARLRAACLFHIPLSFVEYIVRLRTVCIYTFRPLHMPHRLDILLETAVRQWRVVSFVK